VPQEVNAQDPEVIFGREHPNIDVSQRRQLRSRVEDICALLIESGESSVKI
jgi:hypothetical protein